jgi:hypothetical protein
MIAAGLGAVDGVRAEVLSKRPTVGSALQSCISKIEIEGDREVSRDQRVHVAYGLSVVGQRQGFLRGYYPGKTTAF